MQVICELIINMMDYLILYKYFGHFSDRRNYRKSYCALIFALCVMTITFVNQLDIQNLNLFACILMIYLYGSSFSFSGIYSAILPILYIGFGMVAELVGYLTINLLDGLFLYDINYYLVGVMGEIIRYVIVCVICSFELKNLPKLPFSIVKYLIALPILSVVICCMAININQKSSDRMVESFCLVIIIMIVASNVLTFKIFFRVVKEMQNNYKNQMLLKEADLKESYYNEMERSNREVRKIKHDLKNMLLAICAENQDDNKISEEVQKIVSDLDNSDRNMYTSNVVLNTILNDKVGYARKLGIEVDVSVKVMEAIKLEYKELGVLLGNAIDNAIEACAKDEVKLKRISINIAMINKCLFIKVCNNKLPEPADIEKSSKSDAQNHGIGITSMKSIVKKYNGYVEFSDKGDAFEVVMTLYGVT